MKIQTTDQMLLFSGYDPASYSNISSVWVRYYNKIILYPFTAEVCG